jgi:hypothetical protein
MNVALSWWANLQFIYNGYPEAYYFRATGNFTSLSTEGKLAICMNRIYAGIVMFTFSLCFKLILPDINKKSQLRHFRNHIKVVKFCYAI